LLAHQCTQHAPFAISLTENRKTETAPDDEDAFEYENYRNPDHTY
jgi:hypothetical protein